MTTSMRLYREGTRYPLPAPSGCSTLSSRLIDNRSRPTSNNGAPGSSPTWPASAKHASWQWAKATASWWLSGKSLRRSPA